MPDIPASQHFSSRSGFPRGLMQPRVTGQRNLLTAYSTISRTCSSDAIGAETILVPGVGMNDNNAREEMGYLETRSMADLSPERPSPFRPTVMCGTTRSAPPRTATQRLLVS